MDLSLDVPYRCPRCGGTQNFQTLTDLKVHMAEEHAYLAQRRERSHIFGHSPHHSFLGTGRHSPLLHSLLEEGDRLEAALKMAKQEELRDKLTRASASSAARPAIPAKTTAKIPGAKRRIKANVPASSRKTAVVTGAEVDSYLQERVSHLNQEVLAQRHQQYRTADALYSTQDILAGLEEAAEGRVLEQKDLIADLMRQLAEKEHQLLRLRTELQVARERETYKDYEKGHKNQKEGSGDLNGKVRTHKEMEGGAGQERKLIEDEVARKKQELENLNQLLVSARQNSLNSKGRVSRKPSASSLHTGGRYDKNVRSQPSLTQSLRQSSGQHRSDASSQATDISECPLPLRIIAAVSPTSSVSAKEIAAVRKSRLSNHLGGQERDVKEFDHFSVHAQALNNHHNQLSEEKEEDYSRNSQHLQQQQLQQQHEGDNRFSQHRENYLHQQLEEDQRNGYVPQHSTHQKDESSEHLPDRSQHFQPKLEDYDRNLQHQGRENRPRRHEESGKHLQDDNRSSQRLEEGSQQKENTRYLQERDKKYLPNLRQDSDPNQQKDSHLKDYQKQREQFQQRTALLVADQERGERLKVQQQQLVEQMKELLAQAATDNEKLKGQLVAREHQLQTLSQQLQRTRTDQTELMEETFDLYKEAEKSLASLKQRLRAKEAELQSAVTRLEETRGAQQRLSAEKDSALRSSDDKDLLYQNMMRDKDEQINTLNELLLSQQEERQRLAEMATQLRKEVKEREQVQQELQQAISSKEQELSKAREDVDMLTAFLQTASAKESVARGKLEAFVTELIDRANQAEVELKRLQSLVAVSAVAGDGTSLEPVVSGHHSARCLHVPAPQIGTPETHADGKPVKRKLRASADGLNHNSLNPWLNNSVIPEGNSSLSVPQATYTNRPLVPQAMYTNQPLVPAAFATSDAFHSFHHKGPGGDVSGAALSPAMYSASATSPLTRTSYKAVADSFRDAGRASSHGSAQGHAAWALMTAGDGGPMPGSAARQVVQDPLQPVSAGPHHLQPEPRSLSHGSSKEQSGLENCEKTVAGGIHFTQNETVSVTCSSADSHREGAEISHSILLQGLGSESRKPRKRVPSDQNHCDDKILLTRERVPHPPTRENTAGTFTPDSKFEEEVSSSGYAALPTNKPKALSNATPTISRPSRSAQLSAYDAGDEEEHLLSSSHDEDSTTDREVSEQSHNFLVSGSGRVLNDDIKSRSLPTSPVIKAKNSKVYAGQSGGSRVARITSSAASGLVGASKPGRSTLSGPGVRHWRDEAQRMTSDHTAGGTSTLKAAGKESPSQSVHPADLFSAGRTYPIICITGQEAKDAEAEYLSDSALSYQDTPHFHKAILRRRCGRKSDSSVDGLDLSVDENGILWSSVDSPSELPASYKKQPSGSGTAEDVDTSVLLSLHSLGHRKGSSGHLVSPGSGHSTDNDLESLDEDGILHLPSGPAIEETFLASGILNEKGILMSPDMLQTSSHAGEFSKADIDSSHSGPHPDRSLHKSPLPLNERISQLLKKINKDEDSKSLDLLMQEKNSYQNVNGAKDPHLATAPLSCPIVTPEPLYATHPRSPLGRTMDSPLERALVVQNRVKGLTFPRIQNKSVTISDLVTRTPQAKPKSGARATGVPSSNTEKLQSCTRETNGSLFEVLATKKAADASDPFDDFSVSSYMSVAQADFGGAPSISWHDRPQEGQLQESDSVRRQASRSSGSLTRQKGAVMDQDQQQKDLKAMAEAEHAANGAAPRDKPDTSTRQPRDSSSSRLLTTDEMGSARNVEKMRTSVLSSDSSLQYSDDSFSSSSQPPAPSLPSAQDQDNDSTTDFDPESEQDRAAATGKGGAGSSKGSYGAAWARAAGVKRGAGRKLRLRKAAGSKKTGQVLMSDQSSLADSNSNVSDLETEQKLMRRAEKRRRREALFCVFAYLDTPTLCTVAMVCKEWQRVSRHPTLWRQVRLRYSCISSKFLVTISKWCTQLVSLTLEGLRAGSRCSKETLDEYHRRTRGSLESGLEEVLKVSQNTLTSLTIAACGNILTDKCMWLVSGYCRLLRSLTYLSDLHLLTAEAMWALGGGCPSITTLVIPPLATSNNKEGMTNRCLLLISQFYPDLLEIGVGGHQLDISGLLPLVQSCQRLQGLHLHHVTELGEDTATALCRAGLRQLQRLHLVGTPVTPGALRAFYNSCRHLKELDVSVSVGDYFEDFRKIKNKEEYKKITLSLQELKSQAGFGNILKLKTIAAE